MLSFSCFVDLCRVSEPAIHVAISEKNMASDSFEIVRRRAEVFQRNQLNLIIQFQKKSRIFPCCFRTILESSRKFLKKS